MKTTITIGITIGDPSGVGPEVTLKALREFVQPRDCEILIFGDMVALQNNGLAKLRRRAKIIDVASLSAARFRFGVLSKSFGRSSYLYLEEAVKYIKKGIVNCLVTAPVNKRAIQLSRPAFRGHTEYLAQRFGINAQDVVMMFVAGDLRVSLVTRHIALKDVAGSLTQERITKTLSLTYQSLRNSFSIKQPTIAIAGLNPHASEQGTIGVEEQKVITPAIEGFRKALHSRQRVIGPVAPDTIFFRAQKEKFDAIVCMYHDQGLIPFKMLHFHDGINVTLGLPFVRTSPDHGTAFDLAGKNKANYHSMLAALKLAYRLTKNRLRT